MPTHAVFRIPIPFAQGNSDIVLKSWVASSGHAASTITATCSSVSSCLAMRSRRGRRRLATAFHTSFSASFISLYSCAKLSAYHGRVLHMCAACASASREDVVSKRRTRFLRSVGFGAPSILRRRQIVCRLTPSAAASVESAWSQSTTTCTCSASGKSCARSSSCSFVSSCAMYSGSESMGGSMGTRCLRASLSRLVSLLSAFVTPFSTACGPW